jgi:hypothetical protein
MTTQQKYGACASLLAMALTTATPTLAHAGGTRATTIDATTTLTATPGSSKVGTPIILTATVTAATGDGPGGSVTFVAQPHGKNLSANDLEYKSPLALGTVPLQGSGTTRTASFPYSSARSGLLHIGANYSGDGIHPPSSANVVTIGFYAKNDPLKKNVDPSQEDQELLTEVRMQ